MDTVGESRSRLNGQAKRIVPTIVLIVGIVIAFLLFIQGNTNRIAAQNAEYLMGLATQRGISVDTILNENLSFIRTTAHLYGDSLDSAQPDVAVIRDYEENSVFDMVRFVDANGDNYTSSGMQANLADRTYFQAGMRGESGITYVLESRVTGEHQLGFYAPVYFQGEIIGVMVGFYGESYIRGLLEYNVFGQPGEGWLCDRDGTVLGCTLPDIPDNYFDYMAQQGKISADEISQMKQAFARGGDLPFTYNEAGGPVAGYAVSLDSAGWMLIRTFPPAANAAIVDNANREGSQLVLGLLALFALYGLAMAMGVLYDQHRMRDANRNANDITTGVSTLFETFVTVDLETGRYCYIGAPPVDQKLPDEGSYTRFCASLLDRISEEGHRREVADAFTLENLRQKLAHADSLSLRLHAPTQRAEWITYNFIVIERHDGAPKRLLLVCQDVTEMHDRELEEQARLQQALNAAEKASHAKTEFLFNMSHDIRTPMNAIIGYTELAQREGATAEDVRDYIRKIDSSSEHLLALINDILEMSRIESGKITLVPQRANLVQVMDEVREMFASQMEQKGLDFVVDSSAVRDRWVMCDENRLNRIILNLVSNAYKFTPEGGHVSAVLAQKGRDGDEGVYILRVEDTGIGMSPEFATKLFSPFERERTSTVSRTQGTGLGLSITKKIVDLMNGSIDVDTEQGRGTEFTVRLSFPITEGPDAHEEHREEEGAPVDFSGMRLLLVEDNDINMEIATLILSDQGFLLDEAANGREAVDKVTRADPGYYDAVLMDIQMPVMDGYAAARAIRKLDDRERACVPIVAMTANAFQEDVQAAMDAKMDGHIAKPLDVDTMMDTLAKVLRKGGGKGGKETPPEREESSASANRW